jgi:hypothetical protein
VIPYDLIITAAARPALLLPTLQSLLAHVDQPPERILIHDDAVDPDRWEETKEVVSSALRLRPNLQVVLHHAAPPRRLGGALRWLLANVRTEYVLYSQDDHVVVRPLPVTAALATLHAYNLHQIRFNKRATLAFKETWQGRWYKREVDAYGATPLTVSDHWYFQTGVWRAQPLHAAIEWLHANSTRRAILQEVQAEEAINHVMDGRFGPIPGLTIPSRHAADPGVRRTVQRTFIWGPIGEDRYIRHIGGERPTSDHARDGGVDEEAKAWREIRSYQEDPKP